MENLCDLYVPVLKNIPELRFLDRLDNDFKYDQNKIYEGFVGVNIPRIKLLIFIIEFRKKGIECLTVPVRYRDSQAITKNQAFSYAKKYADLKNYEVVHNEIETTPLYWLFNILPGSLELIGGIILVDRIDGHIWSENECKEYNYDYNNIYP